VILLATLLSLRPMPVAAQPAPYFAEAFITPAAPVVGQQTVYTVRVYMETATPHDYLEPDFDGWWRGDQVTTTTAEVVDGRQYTVIVYETLLYPVRAGRVTIEAARIVMPETVFFARVELNTAPLLLDVLPLPDGAPASFNGAVGRFDAEINLDTQTVNLGTPLTLRYRISGTGNLAQIQQPSLQIPDGWRAYPNTAAVTRQTRGVGERIFEWRVSPQAAGTQVLPENQFSYFDPQSGSYQTVMMPSLTVEVLPSAEGERELPTFQRGALAPPPLTIKTGLTDAPIGIPLWLWVLLPLMAGAAWAGVNALAWRKGRMAERRRANALYAAGRHLDAARKLSQAEAFTRVQTAVAGYLADRLNAPTPTLSLAEMDGLFSTIPAASPLIQVLQIAEEGRYAPPGMVDVDAAIQQAASALQTVDAVWKPDTSAARPTDLEAGRVSLSAVAALLLFGLLGLLLSSHDVQAQTDSKAALVRLDEANAVYRAGDYPGAVVLYEAMIAAGLTDAAVHFNLGCAYFETDDLGRALVHYLAAQQSIPRDTDLNRNLALTRALRVDVSGDAVALVDLSAALTEDVLTMYELATVVFVLWAGFFSLLALMIVRGKTFRRARWLVAITGGFLVLALVLWGGRAYADATRPKAVVTAFRTEAFSGPSENYVPLFTLYSAAEGRVIERAAGQVRLLLSHGQQGWLSEGAVQTIR
jgi:tetratricopeptide (TPR) repeat protein